MQGSIKKDKTTGKYHLMVDIGTKIHTECLAPCFTSKDKIPITNI
ncbi:hypothetical protein [Priestia megaterium]|nr:hypothetical protein [Priestia megaterium]